ncbi:hypothetical protein [uncultured Sphaerotilus sp.]|uniref:hypothetical protein n=1 Tax=uncultured Sphaerotilus sp. TaxID=474984 RepID=UPI0030CA307B
MNDHETTDAAYQRLLDIARARLKNHPDLLRSFEHEHAMHRVCGFGTLWAATESPSMLAPDARLCRIVDEWAQAWRQPLAAGRPIRVQPLDARPEQTACPAPSASAPPTADTPAPAPSASAPAVALPEPVAAPAEAAQVLEAARPPTVQQAIAPYLAKLMQERRDHTADTLYQRMRRDAGGDDSPFSRLTQGGELFCVESGKSCGIATVRAALTAYRKRRSSTVEAPSNP